jgi:hypothetical protein
MDDLETAVIPDPPCTCDYGAGWPPGGGHRPWCGQEPDDVDPPPPGLDWRTATRAALGEETQRLQREITNYGNGYELSLSRIAELSAENERLRRAEKTALDQVATERAASRTAHQEIDALRSELADRNRPTANTEWRARIAALLQARLSWRQAEGCAGDIVDHAVAPLLARVADLEAQRAAVLAVLRGLVDLKDGPRNANYERRKPLAWDAARRALIRATLNTPPDPAHDDDPPADTGGA